LDQKYKKAFSVEKGLIEQQRFLSLVY